MKKKTAALLMAMVLVLGVAVGGTVAWLMDETDPLVNTFTVGDIEITLTEKEGEPVDGKRQFKVIPGTDIDKDPVVTVLKDSEKCWLFVNIEETYWNEKLTYEIADGWTKLEDGVYYRIVAATNADTPFAVLKDNKILVSGELDAAGMEAMEANPPELTFTAYAIQYENFEPDSDSADDIAAAAALAWAQAKTA